MCRYVDKCVRKIKPCKKRHKHYYIKLTKSRISAKTKRFQGRHYTSLISEKENASESCLNPRVIIQTNQKPVPKEKTDYFRIGPQVNLWGTQFNHSETAAVLYFETPDRKFNSSQNQNNIKSLVSQHLKSNIVIQKQERYKKQKKDRHKQEKIQKQHSQSGSKGQYVLKGLFKNSPCTGLLETLIGGYWSHSRKPGTELCHVNRGQKHAYQK